MNKRKQDLLDCINACEGAEIEKDDWPLVEELLTEKKIASFGPARGPNRAFRRAEANE